MADTTRATWDAFLLELRGTVQHLFPTEHPFLAELNGVEGTDRVGRFTRDMDANREVFSGRHVRHAIVPMYLQGGGYLEESGTWNVPHTLDPKEVHIRLVRTLVPFSVTVDVERDAFDTSLAQSVAELVQSARIALAKIENIGALGDGTGKVADITGGTSPGLTITVGTSANFDVLLPGTVWDILTKATGANPGNGLRRKIASVDTAAGTITFDTAQQASDGNSGNITFSTAEGIYLPGSWSNGTGPQAPGAKVVQGLEQAAASTGTFEDVDKAAVPAWRGTDGRDGATSTVALSMPLLDQAVRLGRRAGIGTWDFGIGDPAVIDLYKQGLYSQARYDIQVSKLKSGFSGIVYDGADQPFPLIKEPMHGKGKLHLVRKDSIQLYGDKIGPDFLDDDGSMFRRFSRSLPKEADLLDRWQVGYKRCNTIVRLYNLASA